MHPPLQRSAATGHNSCLSSAWLCLAPGRYVNIPALPCLPALPAPQEAAWKAKKAEEARQAAEAAAAAAAAAEAADKKRAEDAVAELKEKYESWRQGGVKGLAGRWKMAPEVGGRRSPGAAAWGGVAGWSRGRMLGAVQLKTARILLESKQAGTGAEVFECRMHYIGSDQTTTISPCPTCLQAAQPGGVVKIMYNRLSGPIVGFDIPPGQSLVLRVGEWVGVVTIAVCRQ